MMQNNTEKVKDDVHDIVINERMIALLLFFKRHLRLSLNKMWPISNILTHLNIHLRSQQLLKINFF